MAEGLFTIIEVRGTGGNAVRRGETGERFDWTADTTPPDPARGGGRAAPQGGPWTLGGMLRTVRTDYPGAKTPSEQVLGPSKRDFTLSGKWDDRYNFDGYAAGEMLRFEEMCERGNICQFWFQEQVFEGLIKDWQFDYKRRWDIGYQFTVSVHNRLGLGNITRAPTTTPTTTELFDNVDLAVQATLDADSVAPTTLLVGDTHAAVETRLAALAASREALGQTLDNREILPTESPVDGFTRIATQFRQVQSDAFNMIVETIALRADVELAVQTALGVIAFEEWTRSLRFMGRIAVGQSYFGDRAASERAAPDAMRLYRPLEGESLYKIARKFYGSPHAWRLIADRNHLTDVNMTGDEILVIPERGQG
jgi:hypothetical protein